MRNFYFYLSTLLFSFMCVCTAHAQELTAADYAGEYYCKSVYSNEETGISGETRYIYFTIEYYEANDSLSLVSLGEKDAMIPCAGRVLFEDGELLICQTVDMEGAESGNGYAYYMGNNESWGHIQTETLSKDKLILTNGITLTLNNFTDVYDVTKGSKLYRVGTPEEPDTEPIADLSVYAGQFYMTASIAGEDKQVTFTMVYDKELNKLYLNSIGYEGNEVACDDDRYEITYNNGTLTFPVVFTPDYSTSLYSGSFTIEHKNKFVVSEEVSGILNTFDMFTVEPETDIRRVGTMEEAWETINLSELAGIYKLTCVTGDISFGYDDEEEPAEGEGEPDEEEKVMTDIYFTIEYANGSLAVTSIGTNRENMKEIDMPLTQSLGELNGDFYFGFDCIVSGYLSENLLFYITGKDELTLVNGFSMLDYDTFVTYDIDSESQEKAIRVNEIPSSINDISMKTATSEDMFDLTGRRIQSPRKGQIYIQNGKKHFVR